MLWFEKNISISKTEISKIKTSRPTPIQARVSHHCDKKLACKRALPLTCQRKQIVCCAYAEGELISLREGVTGWLLTTTASAAVPHAHENHGTDDRWTDWHRQPMHIRPLRRANSKTVHSNFTSVWMAVMTTAVVTITPMHKFYYYCYYDNYSLC